MKDTMTITLSGAIPDYVSREPGKVERCTQYDFPVFLQAGVPMTTPALIDDHLLECERRERQQGGGRP